VSLVVISHDLPANSQDHRTVASDNGLERLFPGLVPITQEPIEQLSVAESEVRTPTENGLQILIQPLHSSNWHRQHLLASKSRSIM
jgi:hypothetical protein